MKKLDDRYGNWRVPTDIKSPTTPPPTDQNDRIRSYNLTADDSTSYKGWLLLYEDKIQLVPDAKGKRKLSAWDGFLLGVVLTSVITYCIRRYVL